MPWPFCSACGTILDPPDGDLVTCTHCSFSCKFVDIMTPEVITKSPPTGKPQWVADEKDSGTGGKEMVKHATIEEPCPRCSHPELYFYTMQLRSVDEGSTVFYECPRCAYKFSVNN
mmetsp:Transcript_24489/g.40830  ORF Transcript_24489/g.40830 Transcript_24489/m.40830 type:complete len:116 (+) Transcript_24489:66-413(+)